MITIAGNLSAAEGDKRPGILIRNDTPVSAIPGVTRSIMSPRHTRVLEPVFAELDALADGDTAAWAV